MIVSGEIGKGSVLKLSTNEAGELNFETVQMTV